MLADTTLLIDFLRGENQAVEKISSIDQESLFTTEINVFELMTGVNSLKRDMKKHKEKALSLISMISILQLDRKSSLKSSEIAGKLIREGKKIEAADCLIAGIALTNGIKNLITANKSHFERIPDIKVNTY